MIASLPEVKAVLGVTGTAEDARLGAMVFAADAWVRGFCNRDFEAARAAEFYSGTGTRLLVLRRRPVTTVHEVLENRHGNYGATAEADGGFSAADALVAGADYALVRDRRTAASAPAGLLERLGTVWPLSYSTGRVGLLSREAVPGLGNLRVDYTAGYAPADVPHDVKLAAAFLVGHWRRAAQFGGALPMRERLGRWEYELAALVGRYGVPDLVTAMLAGHRDPLT